MADTINNMDDDLTTTGTQSDVEPATKHDVTEGGVLGAVGGAVVGMLAGGPIGAVIGAVAGGVASAGAVGVVDKHDHDYDRTAGTDGTHTSVTGLPTDSGSTAHNPGVIGTTAGSTEVLGTAPASYNSNLAQNTGTTNSGTTAMDGETVIPIVEEELVVGKRETQSGGAHIRTGVIETPVEQSVSLHEEHVTVDRQRVNQPVSDMATAFQEKSFEVTETAEVPVVAKSARVVEEVVVGKTATDRVETVHDTVRRTEVEVDELTPDNVKNR